MSTRVRLALAPAAVAAAAALALLVLLPCSAAAAAGTSSMYIVQLRAPPVAIQFNRGVSEGGVSPAGVRPAGGAGISMSASPAAAYAAFLTQQAVGVARRNLGGSAERVKAFYRYAYAGFAAGPLSGEEAAALRADPDVADIVPDFIMQPQAITTPSFLGMTGPGAAWSQLGGKAGAGEGVVVGIIDSGLWPENGPFYDTANVTDGSGEVVYGPPPEHWKGSCSPGEQWNVTTCNNKVIGCKFYTTGYGGDEAVKEQFPYEFASCRDAGSHGSHTASTAAGNWGPQPGFLPGTMSGMAPRARISVYKVCWGQSEDGGGCPGSGSIAAIDQAVKDGVDVINFSIGGPPPKTILSDPVALAFQGAAAAGVFVAASAGNSGPRASTVNHASPWLTTVAASTHSRAFIANLTLGDGVTYSGAGMHKGSAGPAPLVLASAVAAADAEPDKARLCYNGTLDAAKAAGKIVVCDRGGNGRAEKSAAVKAAGGVGVVLLNTEITSTSSDLHAVPTVHLDANVRDTIRAYAATENATATLPPSQLTENALAPQMAGFSSRGPLTTGGGLLLKPDITAPGADILAAVSPAAKGGKLFDLMSGTSMSSPHMAGLAALVKQKHPTWSPMAIKSALMTTAYQTTRTGTPGQSFGGPFDYGAGHVDPTASLNPGLVLDSYLDDWIRFLCGANEIPVEQWSEFCPICQQQPATCEPADLNTPSIALPKFVGVKTVKRTLTSVLTDMAEFTTSIAAPAGTLVTSHPAVFSLAPGDSQVVTITFKATEAVEFGSFADGAITWVSSRNTSTRIPVVLKTELFSAPKEVKLPSGSSGNVSFDVMPGYSGVLATAALGLEPSKVFSGVVGQAEDNKRFATSGAGVSAVAVTLPAAPWAYARFSLFDAELDSEGNDVDLYIYRDNKLVGVSSTGTSSEEVSFANPVPGTYVAYVHGFSLPAGKAAFKLHMWYLRSDAPDSNATTLASLPGAAEPAAAAVGVPVPITVTLPPAGALEAGKRYLGGVVYSSDAAAPLGTSNSSSALGYTVVSVAA